MILEYTSVCTLLQYAASISRFFVYGKNSDGFDNNIVLLLVVVTCAHVKCVYTDNNMTITEEGSTLLDDCPPVITTAQTVYCGIHISLARYGSID